MEISWKGGEGTVEGGVWWQRKGEDSGRREGESGRAEVDEVQTEIQRVSGRVEGEMPM